METSIYILSANEPSLYFQVDDSGEHIGTYWKREGNGLKLASEQVEIEQAQIPEYFNDTGFLDFGKLKAAYDAHTALEERLWQEIDQIIDDAKAAAGGRSAYPVEAVRNYKHHDDGTLELLEPLPIEEYWDAFYPPNALKAWQGKAGLILNRGEKPIRRDKGDILPAYIHDALKWWKAYDAHREKAGFEALDARLIATMSRKQSIKQAMRLAPALSFKQLAYKAELLAEGVQLKHANNEVLSASLLDDIENLTGETA